MIKQKEFTERTACFIVRIHCKLLFPLFERHFSLLSSMHVCDTSSNAKDTSKRSSET